jgi:hypothetical protein
MHNILFEIGLRLMGLDWILKIEIKIGWSFFG